MRKKIVIAVDASVYARQAVNCAVKLATTLPEVDFVLLHVQPIISQYLLEEAVRRPSAQKELNALYEKNQTVSRELLDGYKSDMTARGVAADRIECKSVIRQQGIAEDICQIAEDGSYDAILVGRRGIGGLQEFFMGSVTANLLSLSGTVPVWVVDGEAAVGNVLVAVDGSSQSLRAVDHAAFMLSTHPEARLEIVHIEPRIGELCELETEDMPTGELEEAMLNANEKCLKDFFARARKILAEAGFAEQRFGMRTEKRPFMTGKAVMEAARNSGCDTVVIGKSGSGGSRHLGKVVRYVLQKTKNGAVWLVP